MAITTIKSAINNTFLHNLFTEFSSPQPSSTLSDLSAQADSGLNSSQGWDPDFSPGVDLNSSPFMQARHWIRSVVTLLIVLLGVFGNSMMVVIVLRLSASKTAMDRYLMVIALSDTLFLVTGPLTRWLDHVIGVSLATAYDVMCKVQLWLFSVTSATSAWLLVAMTTQRAMSVLWPHRVNLLCTARRAWAVVVAVVVFFLLTYSHMLYGTGLNSAGDYTNRRCTITRLDYAEFMLGVWVYVDMWLYSFLPFVFLALGNVVLVAKLYKSLRNARDHLSAEGGNRQGKQRSSEALSISVTVIVVSLSFIALTLPIAVNNAVSVVYSAEHREGVIDQHQVAVGFFLETLFQAVWNLNSALNFYLYCLTGSKFRTEFCRVMGCARRE